MPRSGFPPLKILWSNVLKNGWKQGKSTDAGIPEAMLEKTKQRAYNQTSVQGKG